MPCRLCLAPAFCLLMALPGRAEVVTLDCTMTDLSRGGGWIPRAALLKVDTDTKAVQLLKPTGTVRVLAKPMGYDNDFRATGRCATSR